MAAIGYRVVECFLGRLLVAGTPRGVCNIRFGEDPERLVGELQAEFPFAAIEPGGEHLAPWVEALLGYLRGESERLAVPLDVRGSQFQRRVWDAIAAIPYGATRSYAAIATVIGQPRAARAVARACGANPVPLVVPCHRVVESRGGLGGYRYGVARKRALLAAEGARLAPADRREEASGPALAAPSP
jgi:AraC family transcriptional regulator of adaptative response/methylated-DNA-[protein]-cysteine methyltransferase